MGGLTISGRWKFRTGQLDRRTLLRKRYQIQRAIGQGGMGAVYLAKDMKDQGHLCAIKEMSLSMVSAQDQPQAMQNFKVEATILWSLKHANLPSLFGFFKQHDRYYLVMEYIDGSTLEDLLERSRMPFPERRVLGWARQLCDVLSYLHSQKPPIIFRDIKPGNIMLTREGQIKLIDFGIARFFRPKHVQDTQVLGTPGYAPPEQYGTSQTDVRSDIYALGMTLFHLLTNTLSEHGFGLENVHERYPRISPMVARALEKATRIKPDERFESVDAFQNALFGVGSFVFESGDVASTPEELADLCISYPDEAAEYLTEGEIEAWLRDLGEDDLAQVTHYLLKTVPDPIDAIDEFIQAVVGKGSKGRYAAIRSKSNAGMAATVRDYRSLPSSSNHGLNNGSSNGRPRSITPPRTAPIQVSPGLLDFGVVHPGISAPMAISISGANGYKVRGTIRTSDSWLQLSQKQFDGIITEVGVRVNSINLQKDKEYSGKIIIDQEREGQHELVVKVLAEVRESLLKNKRNPAKTHGADLDEEEDEDLDLDDFTLATITSGQGASIQVIPPPQNVHLSEEEVKYLTYRVVTQDGTIENRWDPAPISPELHSLQLLGMTLIAAFMAATLIYILLASLNPPPLPPNPLFIIVLVGMIPAATIGALIVPRQDQDKNWAWREMVNRALTGMSISLLCVTVVEGLWQLLVRARLSALQLFIMLVMASLGAAVGIQPKPSSWLISGISRIYSTLRTARWLVMALAVIIGGGLGYFLTTGFSLTCFTPFGILLGIGVAVALAWRVNRLLHSNRRQKV